MSGFDNPIVLVTRPLKGSTAFIDALRPHAGPFNALIQPAFENTAVNAAIPNFDQAIFTSKAGVDFAPDGNGRVAWCVGDATADAATQRGYMARSANGNAQDLSELILKMKPPSNLLHIRGEISHGNIRDILTTHGMQCAEVVVYRKDAKAIVDGELADQIGGRTLILPVFSADTVSILAGWTVLIERCHVVALSDAVASSAGRLTPLSLTIASKPTLTSMVQQTAGLIA